MNTNKSYKVGQFQKGMNYKVGQFQKSGSVGQMGGGSGSSSTSTTSASAKRLELLKTSLKGKGSIQEESETGETEE